MRLAILLVTLACMVGGTGFAYAYGNDPETPEHQRRIAPKNELADLDLEQLSNLTVTSASKKEESLAGAPAAIYVITSDDLSRGGFTTLPDVLRMVPGLYVAQSNSHAWQISARGFSNVSNNKMLVLIDGRSVYTPSFGGVYWDMQDVPLEDIERIEVIRGPGGTLWGANAVNGVINIVTKRSDKTLGGMVSSSADTDMGYTTTVQYGGRAGRGLTYRLYGKASYWEPFNSPSGSILPNSFGLPQAGMRMDWAASKKDTISIQGGAMDGRFQGSPFLNTTVFGELVKDDNVLVRWDHTFSPRSKLATTAYCDWFARQGFPAEQRNTCDLEFQHDFTLNSRNSVIWGGSFLTSASVNTEMTPARRRAGVENGFIQYEYVVVPDRLRILGGSKLEGNQFSGIEYQPQARVVWTPSKSQALWASFSRAVRDPSLSNSDLDAVLFVTSTPGGLVTTRIKGNPHLQSEHLKATEIGYRHQLADTVSLDLATFYNYYNQLIVLGPAVTQVLPSGIIVTLPSINGTYALGGTSQTHGLELSAKWRPFQRWLTSLGVTETRGSKNAMLSTPTHLFNLQSRIDLPHKVDLDAGLYHYNALPASPGTTAATAAPGVPTFNRVDVGLSWRMSSQWTFGVWGRNVQSDMHVETGNDFFGGAVGEVPRSVVFKLAWNPNGEAH